MICGHDRLTVPPVKPSHTEAPMNSRDRVRAALTCHTPDRIPMALAFWEESFPAIAPRIPAEHFGLDVRFIEFAPPDDQQDFLRYLSGLPHDVHVGDTGTAQNLS